MSAVEIKYESKGQHTERPFVFASLFLQTREEIAEALAALDAVKHLLPNKEEEK